MLVSRIPVVKAIGKKFRAELVPVGRYEGMVISGKRYGVRIR
jgi:hypothetical protein